MTDTASKDGADEEVATVKGDWAGVVKVAGLFKMAPAELLLNTMDRTPRSSEDIVDDMNAGVEVAESTMTEKVLDEEDDEGVDVGTSLELEGTTV